MSNIELPPSGAEPCLDSDSPRPEEVRRQLQSILASPAFQGSRRSQQFLRHVCERSLRDERGTLKERIIAVEVFGRKATSDLAADTIVRVSAREVRKRLAQYYVTSEGTAAEIRVDLPPGSYAPGFRYRSSRQDVGAPSLEPASKPWMKRRRWHWVTAICACALAGALAWVSLARWAGASHSRDPFVMFWEPVLDAPEPLLVTIASPTVYHPAPRVQKAEVANRLPRDTSPQSTILAPPFKVDGSEMIPVFNQYVGFGDMVAANEVASMLARKSKRVSVRMSGSVQFADLRQTQTLLIGAITNRWTMELQQSWRFQFGRAPAGKIVIVDTMDPSGAKSVAPLSRREWSIPATQDGAVQEDYILVCRIRNSLTGGLTLVAAGLKQAGTEAGGRLLADPVQLGAILRKLPPGWESKNLQVVLHAKVISKAPGQPETVAWHIW
jgi:hypothetical protein